MTTTKTPLTGIALLLDMAKDTPFGGAIDEVSRLKSELTAARAEAEALRKDAERYRWLKANLRRDGDDYDSFLSTRELFNADYPDNLDAAIDAAIKADLA